MKRHTKTSCKGRILWIMAAFLFLAGVTVSVWLWVYTPTHGAHLPRGDRQDSMDTEEPPQGPPIGLPADTDLSAATVTPEDPIVYRRRGNDRMEIALSFDDGPHPRYTPLILDILAEYGVRATFFMVGENVTYYPAAAEAVAEAGHEVENHTFTHRGFSRMSEEEMRAELTACEDALSSISESRPHFIRPPEGQLNDTMRRVAGELGYRIVLWDVDTRDWAHTPPETISQHILDTVRPGDIILMHDFIGKDSPTPEALRLVIPALLSRGYHFVTVGELVDGDGARRVSPQA